MTPPFHVSGMERLVEPQEQDYLGKAALERLRETGVDRKLVGMFLEGDQLRAELSQPWPVLSGNDEMGRVTDAVWSPGLKQDIGYMWVPIDLSAPGTRVDVVTEGGEKLTAVAAGLPFVDPEKKAPDGASASEQFEDLLDHQIGLIPDHLVEPSSVGDHRSGARRQPLIEGEAVPPIRVHGLGRLAPNALDETR
jgi:Glycine cleavage T-protein C-terminal barrel domain